MKKVGQRVLAKLRFSKSKKEAILPYSKASTDKTEIAFTDNLYFQRAQGKKELEIMYRNSWAINKAIKVRANLLSSRGLKIVCKSDKAKNLVNTMLKRMHPTRPMLALQQSFRQRSINADIFGNAFDELLFTPKGTQDNPAPVKSAKDLLGFTPIHPINIDFQRTAEEKILFDENQVPKGWAFNRDPGGMPDGIKLPLDRVGHLVYERVGDELWGMGLIEPIYKTAERLMKIEEGTAQGILTYGNPTRDFIIGDEAHPPTKAMIDNVAEETQDFNMLSEYHHPPWIRVGQLESFSLGKIPNYLQPFITAISAATGVPEFILTGRGEGTNKATAKAMVEFVHQTIEPLQQAQALYFEEQILAPLMKIHKVDEVPMIEWNDILPKSVSDYANVVKTLCDSMIDNKHVVTREEVRELAGLGAEEVSFKKPTQGAELAVKETPGIYLTAPHGELICKGKKKLIVKSRDFSDMTMKPLYLVSDKKVYGIIKLREPEKISLEQFDDLNKEHRITEQEREKWWPSKETLFAYKFNVLEMFAKPKDYAPPKGVQVFIKDVKLNAKE